MTIEPREVIFSKAKGNAMRQTFCITPIAPRECILRFFLGGETVESYIRPDEIPLNSYDPDPNDEGNSTGQHYFIKVPTTIKLTNREISAPQRIEWKEGGYLDITLTPKLSHSQQLVIECLNDDKTPILHTGQRMMRFSHLSRHRS